MLAYTCYNSKHQVKGETMDKIQAVIHILSEKYPTPICALKYATPLQFLISARLSAHSTDKTLNKVTPALFENLKTPTDFAEVSPEVLEKYIRPCGLYKTKAATIIQMCKKIVSEFGGEIPNDFQKLISLPGIGRKTANLFLGEIYGRPGIVVDTHFARVTRRLGFHNLKDPSKIEEVMQKIVPEEESIDFCHRVVWHGRDTCKAKKPLCENCVLKNLCKYFSDSKEA